MNGKIVTTPLKAFNTAPGVGGVGGEWAGKCFCNFTWLLPQGGEAISRDFGSLSKHEDTQTYTQAHTNTHIHTFVYLRGPLVNRSMFWE